MLPINVLKIDKTFIDKIGKEDTMNQIIKYIINLAHQLDIEVVAEGVEYEEQLDFLRLTGCDYIQGFLMSKPLKEENVPNLLFADPDN
jgi:EAL domain-containing protein (putative c-di-GMP-specific phosphodiesterase class I)